MEHSTQGGTESSRGPFGTSAGFAGRKNTCVHEEGRKPNLPGTDHNTTTEKKQAAPTWPHNIYLSG